jgi:hypothetical protein
VGEVLKSRSVHLINFEISGLVIALKSATALILDRYATFKKTLCINLTFKTIIQL